MEISSRLLLLILLPLAISCAKAQSVTQSERTQDSSQEQPPQNPPEDIASLSSWKIAIISDMNGSYGSTSYSSSVSAAISHITAEKVHAVLSTGDMVAGQKSGLQYQKMWDAFHSVVTKPLDRAAIPFLPSPGNHDASAGSNFQNERKIYVSNFSKLPKVKFVPNVAQNYPLNYAFTLGPAVFIGLDATAVGPLINSQLTWLEDVLKKTSTAKIKFVFGHVPLYPFAFNKASEYLAYGNSSYGERFESLLETHNVTYFLSGHSHAFYPGHRNGTVRYISVPLLGSGARKILTSDRTGSVAKSSFLYFTYNADGDHHLEALESPSYKPISYQSLPPAVSIPKADAADCKSCGSFPKELFLNSAKRELFYRLEQ